MKKIIYIHFVITVILIGCGTSNKKGMNDINLNFQSNSISNNTTTITDVNQNTIPNDTTTNINTNTNSISDNSIDNSNTQSDNTITDIDTDTNTNTNTSTQDTTEENENIDSNFEEKNDDEENENTTSDSEEKVEESENTDSSLEEDDENYSQLIIDPYEQLLIKGAKHRKKNNCHCYKNKEDMYNSECVSINESASRFNDIMAGIGTDFSYNNLEISFFEKSKFDVKNKLYNPSFDILLHWQFIYNYIDLKNSHIIQIYEYILEKSLVEFIRQKSYRKAPNMVSDDLSEQKRLLKLLKEYTFAQIKDILRFNKRGYGLKKNETRQRMLFLLDKMAFIAPVVDFPIDDFGNLFRPFYRTYIDYCGRKLGYNFGQFIDRNNYPMERLDLPILRKDHWDKDESVLIIGTAYDPTKIGKEFWGILYDYSHLNPELNKLHNSYNLAIEYIDTEDSFWALGDKMKKKAEWNTKKFDYLIICTHANSRKIIFGAPEPSDNLPGFTIDTSFFKAGTKCNKMKNLLQLLLNDPSYTLLSACSAGKRVDSQIPIAGYLCSAMPGKKCTVTASTVNITFCSGENWFEWCQSKGNNIKYISCEFSIFPPIFHYNRSQAREKINLSNNLDNLVENLNTQTDNSIINLEEKKDENDTKTIFDPLKKELLQGAKHRKKNMCHCYKNKENILNSKCKPMNEDDTHFNDIMESIGIDFSYDNLELSFFGNPTFESENSMYTPSFRIEVLASFMNKYIDDYDKLGNSHIIQIYEYILEKSLAEYHRQKLHETNNNNRSLEVQKDNLQFLNELIFQQIEKILNKNLRGYGLSKDETKKRMILLLDKIAFMSSLDTCSFDESLFKPFYETYLDYCKKELGYKFGTFIDDKNYPKERLLLPIVRKDHWDKDESVLIIGTAFDYKTLGQESWGILYEYSHLNPELNKLRKKYNLAIEYIQSEDEFHSLKDKMKKKAAWNTKKFDYLIFCCHGEDSRILFGNKNSSNQSNSFDLSRTCFTKKDDCNKMKNLFKSVLNDNSHVLMSAPETGKKKNPYLIPISQLLGCLLPGIKSTVTAPINKIERFSGESWYEWCQSRGKNIKFISKKLVFHPPVLHCDRTHAKKMAQKTIQKYNAKIEGVL